MCTHNQCFRAKKKNNNYFSAKKIHFYRRERLLYIPWACLRNVCAREREREREREIQTNV